jgi:indole-3-acetate monooxygenase
MIDDTPLSEDDIRLIHLHASTGDSARTLAPPLQSLIHERGWLRMLAPQSCGGAELALPAAVRLEEAIAAADGSAGWTVTLCAGAGWFAGFLPPAMAREIIGTARVCVGGSGAPTGFADIEGNSFRLHGRWDFATGAPLATHFTMNAVIRKNGAPVTDSAGARLVRAFIVPAACVKVHETWRSIGLRATASHSFSVDQILVGREHAFDIDAAHATAPGPLYRFPFVSLAYVTLAANLSGMALHFVQLAAAGIARRRHASGVPLDEMPQVRAALSQARNALAGARAHVYRLLDAMWGQVCSGAVIADADRDELRRASMQLVGAARAAVDGLYPFCGLHAAHEENEINRVWRDLHTATQHAMLLPLDEL